MNDLVAELRELHDFECKAAECGSGVSPFSRAADEIERLTDEFAMRPSEYRDHYRELYGSMKAECDRLRAALINLMVLIRPLLDKPYGISSDEGAILDAREALAGASDSQQRPNISDGKA